MRCHFGRPRIPDEHIDFIRTISRHHPELGEDQIALELEAKLGVRHSPSTVRRYRWRPPRRPENRPGLPSQSWRTLFENHIDAIWACDFVVELIDLALPVYIFVVMELGSRRIVWVNVTTSPSLDWVKAQIRQAAPFDSAPKFLIHDNDGIFGQFRKREKGRPFRCELDRWLEQSMGVHGIPIPYRAPNANAHVERFNRTLREQVLRHFVFINPRHLLRVLRRYVEYYNRARPSQAIGKIPDPYPALRGPPPSSGKLVALPVLGGLHHDYRRAA
jgi:transposase InsO family protein